jgi:hypothetical protein
LHLYPPNGDGLFFGQNPDFRTQEECISKYPEYQCFFQGKDYDGKYFYAELNPRLGSSILSLGTINIRGGYGFSL